jgi:5-methylcytosine-specific restriction endonuclease McrA|tara:strand:+ start:431 stop:688 length:258 start_codon:yes stop_codon:yes gene_type:complete
MTKRNFKREYELQKKRGDTKGQLERQKARRLLDKTKKDNNKNGKADVREGKDIDHKKPISKGGKSNVKNLRVRSRSSNRKDNKRR